MPMIVTYSDYIQQYLLPSTLAGRPCPGEHHFVAAYLVPRLYELNGLVPDYINPDGTKGIIGDVTYYRDGSHQFGIEVKLGTVRLTKGEFNNWVVSECEEMWPHTYIGVGLSGITVCSWAEFRTAYIAAVQLKQPKWAPHKLHDGYGPMKNVDVLSEHVPKGKHFGYTADPNQAAAAERQLIQALEVELGI